MHRVVFLWQLALWVTGIRALLPFHSESLQDVDGAEKRDVVARDTAGSMGFVTFKMTKTGSNVGTHPLHGHSFGRQY
jgi:hypothetical protein